MSKRKPPSGPKASRPTPCTVVVCRGCCCGTSKVPGVDHLAQYNGLKSSLKGLATVRASDCLDACEQANVIVVQPSSAGRAAGGRPIWLAMANDADIEQDITAWVEAGGPGMAQPPSVLGLYEYRASRRQQACIED
jgi:hypothetical protein